MNLKFWGSKPEPVLEPELFLGKVCQHEYGEYSDVELRKGYVPCCVQTKYCVKCHKAYMIDVYCL